MGPACLLALAVALHAEAAFSQSVKPYAECGREPTETDIAGAKGAFQAGQVSFDEADYRRAIDYWEDAYRRDCTAHALLLNLARAYELNGERAQAIVALETYLQRVPTSPDQEKIQRRIEVLKRQYEAEQAAALAAAPPPTLPPTPAPPPPTAPEPKAEPAEPAAPSGRRPLLPLFVAGAGAAVAVVGTILYIPAYSDLQDIEESCPDHECADDRPDLIERGNDVRARVNVAGALTIGGVVVAGAGLTWYFLSPRSGGAQAGPRLVPALAPSYAGLSYSGRF